jgi:hypothetical protein
MIPIDQLSRVLITIETYVIAVIREAINDASVTAPASRRQDTVEARGHLLTVVAELDNGIAED